MTFKAPVDDMAFVINDVLKPAEYYQDPEIVEMLDAATIGDIIGEAAKLAEASFAPVNKVGDQQGCDYIADGSEVKVPEGYKNAYNDYVEAGWGSLSAPAEHGGQGLPGLLNTSLDEMFAGANISLSMYSGLTHGSIVAISQYADSTLRDYYLKDLITGRYTGTMCLTEAHCGTDLGLLKTKAVPAGEKAMDLDLYKVSGSKIWITGGEHDLTDNIVHLVLARLPDAPAGTKGISMFLVPKFLPDGERNTALCTGLEHKMGIKGSATCFMSFEDAKGWLVGEPHQGLKYMFAMMNSARLMVGMQGLGLAEAAYQVALGFAKERRQGRSLMGTVDKDADADNILVHPDVRRMLLTQKVSIEGCRALAYWVAMHEDIAHNAGDEEAKQAADDMVALMTPVVKAFLTDQGSICCDLAVQSMGGSGFTSDWAAEQCYRDVRISRIYEGTNGIQALDLVGRKLALNNGGAIRQFIKMAEQQLEAEKDDAIKKQLQHAIGLLNRSLQWLMQNSFSDRDQAGAAATPFLRLFALVSVAVMWSKMAQVADEKIESGAADSPLLKSKTKSKHFFFTQCLPEIETLIQVIENGKDTLMAFEEDEF